MTRNELASTLAKKTGLTTKQANKLIDAFGKTITTAIQRGDKVVYSNFGTFYTVHYPSKVITHPKLGAAKKMIMLPTNVAKWMPSPNIRQVVNSESMPQSPTAHGSKKKIVTNIKELTPSKIKNNQPSDKIEVKITSPASNTNHNIDIETNDAPPLISKEKRKDVNIYEELMQDGSKEETTFNGVIHVPKERSQPFWSRLFNKEKENEEKSGLAANNTKVSMVDSGIFDKQNTSLPNLTDDTQTKESPEIKAGLLKDEPLEEGPFSQTLPKDPPSAQPEKDLVEETAESGLMPFQTAPQDISYINLAKTIVPKEILQKIPEKIARRYKAVPIEETEKELIVAMIDPEDLEAKELIKKYSQKQVSLRLASEADINHVLDQYQGFESEVEEAIKFADTEEDKSKEKEEKSKNATVETSDSAPAARIVSSLLKRAIRDKASDIHIEPGEKDVQVRFRLDGVLHKKVTLPKDIQSAVVSRIKIMANLKIDEQRLPQDGRFSLQTDNRKVDFRISTFPTSNGEKIVMRILDKATGILTVEELGLEGSGLSTLGSNVDRSHGMVLVTGPTGSGKTTTLYALIDRLFHEGVNIVTLEDPIEYQIQGINQSQVNADINYTFASGLRSIVRQDPDIIMIGEIRDSETAEMAVHAALTGHVVLSTLHTNEAAGAVPRLIDMGVEPFLLTSSINLVIGQRLARKLCEECQEKVSIPSTELEKVKKIISSMPEKERKECQAKSLVFYKGKGCKSCGESGYKGRIGVFEVLAITEEIKEAVLQKVSSSQIQARAIENGMVTMAQDGIIKAINTKTSLEEVWRVTKD